jgi:ABC-type bacteriocin/lantibiotic exporter with double-glycine peptidase domain
VNLTIDFDIPISEQEAADRMQLMETGASIAQIGYLLEELGFKFDETTTTDLDEIQFPSILSVHFMGNPNTHVVYLKERKGRDFIILDPAQGIETYRGTNWFNDNWNGIGIHNISR